MKHSFSLFVKKAASLVTMASMLSSMLNLGMMLPVKAQEYIEADPFTSYAGLPLLASTGTLASLKTFINNPVPSSEDCIATENNPNPQCSSPQTTNISYEFSTTDDFIIQPGLSAIIKIVLNNYNESSFLNEQWEPAWISAISSNLASDIAYQLPSNIELTSATSEESRVLELQLACNSQNMSPCVFDAGTPYTIDLKSNPILNPAKIGPHMHLLILTDENNFFGETKMAVNSYYKGLNVTASVDARLVFKVAGRPAGTTINNGALESNVSSSSDGCEYGTLVPYEPKVCMWNLSGETNAPNGLDVYVVQDGNMTYSGSGAQIEQFKKDFIRSQAFPWEEPLAPVAAHLGYTSDFNDFYTDDGQLFYGISNLIESNNPVTYGSLSWVTETSGAGKLDAIYANKIETNSLLEQAPAALGQSYGHTQYFIVVGKF